MAIFLFLAVFLAGCGPAAAPARKEAAKPEPPKREALSVAPEVVAPKAKILEKDAQGCTWIESEGTVVVSELESPHQARAGAVAQARINAMQDFLGIEVKSRSLDYQQEGLREQKSLTESMLQTTRQGRILKEEITAKGYKSLSDCENCRYWVRLKTCLMPIPEAHDKDFSVELKVRERFDEGDEAKITVTATRDCYIYLYDVGMDWETSILVPNEYVPQAKLGAGEAWQYPDSAASKRGIHLVAQLPESRPPVSAETIRVIASRTPLPESLIDPKRDGFLGVLRRLNLSKADWEDDAAAFTIYKAK